MLQSMTGFGSAQGRCDGVEYSVEIRSVNHRYFKATVKLPEMWSSAEAQIDGILRDRLQRGSITLSVRMKISDESAAHAVNTEALAKYIRQVKAISAGDADLTIDLAVLLAMPGVCNPPEMDDLRERTYDDLMRLIAEAVDALAAMRMQEGQAIQADLLKQCDLIDANLQVVAERSPQIVRDYHTRLAERVEELVGAARIDIDQDYLAREVAVFADRCDINEEISRQKGHLEQFRETCNCDEPSGRKLDFIAQEMLREANTVASKANDADVGRAVVEMKTAIDRFKEQVQNVV